VTGCQIVTGSQPAVMSMACLRSNQWWLVQRVVRDDTDNAAGIQSRDLQGALHGKTLHCNQMRHDAMMLSACSAWVAPLP
jgi:hypothetical protein